MRPHARDRSPSVRWRAANVWLAAGALGLAALASAADRASATEPVVEYWTIEANEGQSAGGHAAIRIGETIHHLQHRGDGLIQNRRDPRVRFESAYRGRGNRAIDVLTLDVTPDERRALSDRLRRRAIARDLELDGLERREETLRWLEAAIDSGTAAIAVPGLGLYEPAAAGRSECGPGVRLDLSRGEVGSARRSARSDRDRALAGLARPNPGEETAAAYQRLLEATQLHAALRVIDDCRSLRPDRLRVMGDAPPLDDEARATLLRMRDALASDLTRLIASERADRGLALLLAWGRLEAAEATLAEGRWIVVDAFAERADAPFEPLAFPEAWQDRRASELHARARIARRAVVGWEDADGTVERALDGLERIAHDLHHAERNSRHDRGQPLGALEASRALERPGAVVALAWPARFAMRDLEVARDHLLERTATARRALQRELGYDLIRRNCVTELLAALDDVGIAPGVLDAPAGFAPVGAHAWLARNARITSTREDSSARRSAIESALRTDETSSVALVLRESNTLSGRFYRPHAEDSSFLFFAADAPVPLRPFAGLANFVWGTGSSLAGLFSAPLDGGRLLGRGLRGVVMSVPELFFITIRKGSYATAPPRSVLD